MYDAPITRKIFEVLRFVVAQQSDVGVSEIARAGGLSKGTTFGILAGLEKEGYVIKNSATRKYSVGPELFQLSRLIDRRTDLATIAKPYLETLSKKLNKTVFLGVLDEDRIRIAEVVEASGLLTISSSIGTRLPLNGGAPGKVMLSVMREEEVFLRIGNHSFFNGRGKRSNEAEIWSEIEEVRRLGYALDLSEEYTPGIWAVAMALACEERFCPAVVWVAGFKAALTERKLTRIISSLRDTVTEINGAVKARCEEGYRNIGDNPAAIDAERSEKKVVAGADRT